MNIRFRFPSHGSVSNTIKALVKQDSVTARLGRRKRNRIVSKPSNVNAWLSCRSNVVDIK